MGWVLVACGTRSVVRSTSLDMLVGVGRFNKSYSVYRLQQFFPL